MPRGSVLAAAPRFPTVETLIKTKKLWSVSVAALAHRLHSLDLLSEWHYRGLCIEMTKRGYRKAEPEGVPRETSQVLNKVFAALREEGISKSDVARELCIHPSELDALVFGLILVPVSGTGGDNKGGGGRRGPNLRLV
jgi:Zn-dependent peptidase ImmA (M78 family)